MKYFFLISCLLAVIITNGQTKLHAHNDYEKPQPLFNALSNKVFTVEADVFFTNGTLTVAHTKKEIDSSKTLLNLYLLPIVELFKQHHGYISDDTLYRVALMIDIKENAAQVIPMLVELIKPRQQYFDRSINAKAVQIILSGDRGPVEQWTNYPGYIFFDGRPFEQYDAATLQRVAVISDNFMKYATLKLSGDLSKLITVIHKAHDLEKPIRLWAAPDEVFAWQKLRELGVDIINTDKVEECNRFLNQKKLLGK